MPKECIKCGKCVYFLNKGLGHCTLKNTMRRDFFCICDDFVEGCQKPEFNSFLIDTPISFKINDGAILREVLLELRAVTSIGDGRRLIGAGGIYVNGERQVDVDRVLTRKDVIGGVIKISRGKKKHYFVGLEP